MAFSINEKCTGCTACVRRCPENAIYGERQKVHVIDERLCIECGACGMICPAEAITDGNGNPLKRLKRNEIPVPKVDIDLCSGCQLCSDICPFNCIKMVRDENLSGNIGIAYINVRRCVGCGLCKSICIKEAINMDERS